MAPANIFSAAPYHIIAYGTLLGTTFYQTFVGGIISFQHLPRPFFGSLMSKIFPAYFVMQTALPVALALTYPGSVLTGAASGVAGVLHPANRWSVLLPLVVAAAGGVANLAVVGPATTQCMEDRRVQEKKDGKKAYDAPPHSAEMAAMNKRFSILHGVSSALNMAEFIAILGYGFVLAARIV